MVLNVLHLNITMENELLNLSECKSPVTLVLHCNYMVFSNAISP